MTQPGLREKLLAEGWEERFSASGRRIEEVVSYYRNLGFEVRVEDLEQVAADGSCTTCFAVEGAEGPTRVIFTRAGGAMELVEEEDLFDPSEGESE